MKRKKERKRYWHVLFFAAFVLTACMGIFFSLTYLVRVREIVFTGNSHIKNEELKALVRIRNNDRLFRVSGSEICRNLMQSPWIKDAVVRKELSGRVQIKVTEGVPVAVLRQGGRQFLVDRDGVLLEQLREGTALFLPVIKDIDPSGNKGAFDEAVKLVNVLREKKSPLYDGNVEISGLRPEDITLRVGPLPIRVGSGDFDKKLERLEFVRDEVRKRNMPVESIDLRFENKIVVKPAVQQQVAAEVEVPEKPEQVHGKKKKKQQQH